MIGTVVTSKWRPRKLNQRSGFTKCGITTFRHSLITYLHSCGCSTLTSHAHSVKMFYHVNTYLPLPQTCNLFWFAVKNDWAKPSLIMLLSISTSQSAIKMFSSSVSQYAHFSRARGSCCSDEDAKWCWNDLLLPTLSFA